MLYNIDKQRLKQDIDCCSCPHFDKPTKTCNGIGLSCFEYNQDAQKCINPITKLSFDPKGDSE